MSAGLEMASPALDADKMRLSPPIFKLEMGLQWLPVLPRSLPLPMHRLQAPLKQLFVPLQ